MSDTGTSRDVATSWDTHRDTSLSTVASEQLRDLVALGSPGGCGGSQSKPGGPGELRDRWPLLTLVTTITLVVLASPGGPLVVLVATVKLLALVSTWTWASQKPQ